MASLLLLAGCPGGEAKDVVVTWRLIDGRSCVDTAVVRVELRVDGSSSAGTMGSGGCNSVPALNSISLSGIAPGALLHAQGLSQNDAVLYRADLQIPDPVPAQLDLPLYYTGGQ